MDETEGKPQPDGARSPRKAPRAGADVAFDLWLQRGLHQLYDGVAAEPIPPELLRLIEEDRLRRKG